METSMETPQPTPTVQMNAAAAASTPGSTFDQRRDLQYLEKLTCRVLAALQTFGTADLDTQCQVIRAQQVSTKPSFRVP